MRGLLFTALFLNWIRCPAKPVNRQSLEKGASTSLAWAPAYPSHKTDQ